nr:MAG: ssl1498 family light-harvesting-like protein [Leptolyngbya sp. IPPAS B-1204]
MSYIKTQGKTLNPNEKHRSDGSELIPAEVQANVRLNEADSIDASFTVGYTIDDEGLINNFTIEPDMYLSDYPSVRQQRHYIVLGAGAFSLVVLLLLTAFLVS